MSVPENQLIESLPCKERLSLLKICESIPLVLSDDLVQAGEIARHVYFPVDGFISLVRPVDAHEGLEVGMVGREGMRVWCSRYSEHKTVSSAAWRRCKCSP